jgi:four helix bundle protein
MSEKQFRFQDLDVWQRAAALTPVLFRLTENLERGKWYRFAEQLRAATLSITNNIAEGSGSTSQRDFANFLNMARRSVFEVANMLIILRREDRLSESEAQAILNELEQESRMLITFMRTLQAQ